MTIARNRPSTKDLTRLEGFGHYDYYLLSDFASANENLLISAAVYVAPKPYRGPSGRVKIEGRLRVVPRPTNDLGYTVWLGPIHFFQPDRWRVRKDSDSTYKIKQYSA